MGTLTLSDTTMVWGLSWSFWKAQGVMDGNYHQRFWWREFGEDEKNTLGRLIAAQTAQGNMYALEPVDLIGDYMCPDLYEYGEENGEYYLHNSVHDHESEERLVVWVTPRSEYLDTTEIDHEKTSVTVKYMTQHFDVKTFTDINSMPPVVLTTESYQLRK